MGRWSADHWKTATFGWLAFVLVVFALGGMVGTKTIDQNKPGPGESGRMDRILDEGFKQPAGESVLIQSSSLRVSDPAFAEVIEDVVAGGSRRSEPSRTCARRSTRRTRVRSRRTSMRRSSSSRSAATPTRRATRSARSSTESTSLSRSIPSSSSASSETQARSTRSRRRSRTTSRRPASSRCRSRSSILVIAFGALVAAGIPLLLALTAVFGTFGLVALSSHVLPVAERGARARAPDRARGRRRLLDVLLEAGARGACRRTQRARRGRSRRRHVRPLGAHLGPDGHGGDGRHVPDRRQDLRLVRDRDDRSSSRWRCSAR